MSIDSQEKAISSLGVPTIEESLAMIGRVCAVTIPRPPVGIEIADLAQTVALAGLEKGISLESLGFLFIKHRSIDATKRYASRNDPGNREFVKAVNALCSGEPLEPVSNIWGQAAQRRAINRYGGRGKEDRDSGTSAEPTEDRTASEYEEVETTVDGLLETLLERCPITSLSDNATRNSDIVRLHLEGLSFKEIEDNYGVNNKTATSVWRNFFTQARSYLDEKGIDLDTIRGNV